MSKKRLGPNVFKVQLPLRHLTVLHAKGFRRTLREIYISERVEFPTNPQFLFIFLLINSKQSRLLKGDLSDFMVGRSIFFFFLETADLLGFGHTTMSWCKGVAHFGLFSTN